MRVSSEIWNNYVSLLSKMNDTASKMMLEFIQKNPIETQEDIDKWIQYAYALAKKYGEGAAALAADVYDQLAEAEGVYLPPAEVADTATYGDVAKLINGTRMFDQLLIAGAVGRLVKLAGADTVLKNAMRDQAFVAWIAIGDTCPYCLSIAAEGWIRASQSMLKNGHASHIHANCNCQYAVRHQSTTEYDSYDEEKYQEIFANAEGDTPKMKINFLRRETGE